MDMVMGMTDFSGQYRPTVSRVPGLDSKFEQNYKSIIRTFEKKKHTRKNYTPLNLSVDLSFTAPQQQRILFFGVKH